jgi:phosphoribosylformylglycinamidine synthase
MKDIRKSQTIDFKFPGDLVYLLGSTADETGGASITLLWVNAKEGEVYRQESPVVDAVLFKKINHSMEKAIEKELVASVISIERGGLGVAAAKSALAGMYGIELNLGEMKERDVLRNDIILYSESQGRFLVSVNPSLQNEFEECFKGLPLAKIGRVRDDQRVIINWY